MGILCSKDHWPLVEMEDYGFRIEGPLPHVLQGIPAL